MIQSRLVFVLFLLFLRKILSSLYVVSTVFKMPTFPNSRLFNCDSTHYGEIYQDLKILGPCQILYTIDRDFSYILRFTSYFPFYWRCAKTLVALAQTSSVCSITTTIHKKGSLYTPTSLASMLVYELWAFRVH